MRQQTNFFLSQKSSYKNIFLCGTILAPNFMRANLLLEVTLTYVRITYQLNVRMSQQMAQNKICMGVGMKVIYPKSGKDRVRM